ncbi:YciE/YciF ferroxidase family protein [Aureliella helgolandensis]|uniref:Uncharacterized protein n=1 Tax=Aureliella helgolandensis TaxID=2527968 RepID=A0A518G329_9BACT|nr:DUF892 family protein [Aureliella helgolandensis]QDV23002.1 hypothetical protein Q31a_12950 [Aureliella helgolandensis]
MKFDSLEKLYVHELKDLFSAEHQFLAALPELKARATDEDLSKVLMGQMQETRVRIGRIESVFSSLDFEPGGHRCTAMEGLIEEGGQLLSSDIEPRVMDAALVASLQRIEHYGMAGYGTARSFAEKLGRKKDADVLQVALNELGESNRHLTTLAERKLNFLALNLTH